MPDWRQTSFSKGGFSTQNTANIWCPECQRKLKTNSRFGEAAICFSNGWRSIQTRARIFFFKEEILGNRLLKIFGLRPSLWPPMWNAVTKSRTRAIRWKRFCMTATHCVYIFGSGTQLSITGKSLKNTYTTAFHSFLDLICSVFPSKPSSLYLSVHLLHDNTGLPYRSGLLLSSWEKKYKNFSALIYCKIFFFCFSNQFCPNSISKFTPYPIERTGTCFLVNVHMLFSLLLKPPFIVWIEFILEKKLTLHIALDVIKSLMCMINFFFHREQNIQVKVMGKKMKIICNYVLIVIDLF